MVRRRQYQLIKRTIDVAASTTGLAALAPVLGLTAAAVWADDGGPVIYRQTRIGLDGAPFTILKFRSMRGDDGGGPHEPRPGDPDAADESHRITRSGRVLRRWALDELPQLINVLRGEMSLVGPRPLIPEHDAMLRGKQERRRTVKPGLTGWAAVTGGSSRTWDERVDRDLYYVDHASTWMDLAIILLSFPAIASYGEPHGHRGRVPEHLRVVSVTRPGSSSAAG
jgi:lipopolysaccharide/colanic/teichoic acid biosynthesis glycosyltransferase